MRRRAVNLMLRSCRTRPDGLRNTVATYVVAEIYRIKPASVGNNF